MKRARVRSTIFISFLMLAIPAQSHAQEILSCYARTYTDAHLAKHPEQVVKSLVFAFTDGHGEIHAGFSALIADGGHAKGGPLVGTWLDQGMICFGPADTVGTGCAVECDGGFLEVTKVTDNSLTFRTEYLTAGDTEGCGGSLDLAEQPGRSVSYKLDRADPSICKARFP